MSEPDYGRYDAMNKGIKFANGEFLNFLNAGDYYFYNDVLKDIFENKKYSSGVLYGNECIIRESILKSSIQPMPQKLTKEFLYFSTIRHQATFISKILFEKYGLYDDNFLVVSDYKKWFEFLDDNVVFHYLPYTVTNFNSEGISCAPKTRDIAMNERLQIINEYFSKSELNDLKIKYKKLYKIKYSFLEQIFSLKNSTSGIHKVITILGLHIKIKRK